MSYTVNRESFESLASIRADLSCNLNWGSPFVLPAWLRVWWQEFGAGAELYLRSIRDGDNIIGIAPLLVREGESSIIGSADVCDYLDFVVVPGMENDFFAALLNYLRKQGINRLEMSSLRPDSTVLTSLVNVARQRGHEVVYHREDVSLDMDLPATWEGYLATLTAKQRHEVRRKLRRLLEAGNIEHRCLETNLEDYSEIFFRLFSLSRGEKAGFMTPEMASFFRALMKAMSESGLLRFGIVELDGQPVAMTLGFDYNNSHYLYNSAYDPQFNSLSVGLLCKVLCIKESIEKGKKKWDFLKGGETYKYQLGGQEIPLYGCRITIG